MKESILKTKSLDFSVRVVNLYHYLRKTKKEYVMSDQLLRSGTSIGANIHEAGFGQSKRDFAAKMQIALKETSETHYWLSILSRTQYLTPAESCSMLSDCTELGKMLTASLNTVRNTATNSDSE